MANPESKPSKVGWLWETIFGRKKSTSKKRVGFNDCCVNSQDTINAHLLKQNNKAGQKLPALSFNLHNSRASQEGECPGKTLSTLQRGCGFHVYFCVDKSGKSKPIRSNVKKLNSENLPESASNVENSVSCKTKTVKSQTTQSPKSFRNNVQISLNPREAGTLVTDSLSTSATSMSGNNVEKSKENVEGKQMNSNISTQGTLKTSKGAITNPYNKISSHTTLKPQPEEVPNKNKTSPDVSPERFMYNVDKDLKNETKPSKTPYAPDIDEETICKAYADLQSQQNKSRRKSTSKSRGGFARNSLISIRKKRQSLIDNVVPEILLKLENIEDKLKELERIYEDGRENITNIVGISCNSVKSKSTSSMDVKSLSKSSSSLKPSMKHCYTIQPILIKSNGEEIFINAPKSVSVVKKNRSTSKQGSKQLVLPSTQILHSQKSTHLTQPKEEKSNNSNAEQKTPTSELNKTEEHISSMWKKISEELKLK